MNNKSKQVTLAKRQAATVGAYQNVFGTSDGELVLKDLMHKYGVLGNLYDGDVNSMLVREGERRVVLDILGKLKWDVSQLKERIDRYANEEI